MNKSLLEFIELKHLLRPHNVIDNVTVEVSLKLEQKNLKVVYTLKGELEKYVFVTEESVKIEDDLWKTTCFELFLAKSGSREYYEFNISPSLAWNLYHLRAYRTEISSIASLFKPSILVHKETNCYTITFTMNGFDFSKFDSYNLSTILLSKEGKRTFWSIKSMLDIPDFHNQRYFCKMDLSL